MNLQFDSLAELEQFLLFTAHIGSAFRTAPTQSAVDNAHGATAQPFSVDRDASLAISDEGIAAAAAASTEVPKRKRRTKAEMAADADAAAHADGDNFAAQVEPAASVAHAVQSDNSAETAAATAVAASMPASGNPFAVAPAMQAVLDAPNQGAATLAAKAATQNAETAPAGGTLQGRAAAILLDPTAVESIAHLRACQSFIQKHGMPKYNDSFKEGLNANIAAYQPDQRALHLAILESLDA